MTIQEINEQYGIPMEILQEYESWKQCGNPTKTSIMMIVTSNV